MRLTELEDLIDYQERKRATEVALAARKAAWKPRAALITFVAALFLVFVYVESKANEHEDQLRSARQAIEQSKVVLEAYDAARRAGLVELNQCVSRLKGRIGPFRDM